MPVPPPSSSSPPTPPDAAKEQPLRAHVPEADAACIRDIIDGKRERFEELVDRYKNAVFAVAFSITHDAHKAEDLSQEIFVNAFGALNQLRDPGSFYSWLMMIARNRAVREAQKIKSRPEKPLSPEFDPEQRQPDPDMERASNVMALVEELDEPYRETVLLKYRDGLSCKEIAERQQVPIGTITSRLARAIAVLRTALGTERQ